MVTHFNWSLGCRGSFASLAGSFAGDFAAGPVSVYSVGRDDPARRLRGRRGFRRHLRAKSRPSGGCAPKRACGRSAGGEFLCPWRQRNQNAPGDASDGLRLHYVPPRSIGRFPRTPFTGVIPLAGQIISGAQNLSECLNSRRATGPWVRKNCDWCGSTSAPEFAEPTLPVQIAFPLQGGRPIPPVRGKWPKAKRGRGARRSRDE